MLEFIKSLFKKKDNEEKITCLHCKNLVELNDGSVYCLKQNEQFLEYFNKENIRPCKELDEID